MDYRLTLTESAWKCLFMNRRLKYAGGPKGITVLEILIVVVIIAILAGLAIPTMDAMRRRAERVQCMSHMRSLHGSLEGFLSDYDMWPQPPKDLEEEDYWKFWIAVLTPYGGTQDLWLCPTDRRFLKQAEDMEDTVYGSYAPTVFSPKPLQPYRWQQPWLVERSNNHGAGPHLLMPDGSVRVSKDFFIDD